MAEELGKLPETELLEINENRDEGKLKIMIRSPRIEEEKPTERMLDDQYLCVCEFCNKSFSSGKALGGHMRIHAQENKGGLIMTSRNLKKLNLNSTKKSYHLDSLAENPSCDICGKGFPSLKSLFGHMRCHPERDYRGIQPPQTGSNHLSSSSSVSDEKKSTNPTLPSWRAKDKRGRMSLSPSSMSSCLDDHGLSEEEIEVIASLLMLAQGDSFHHPKIEGKISNPINIGAEFGRKDPIFETRKRKSEVLGYGSESKKPMFDETVEVESELGHKDQIFESKKLRIGNLGYGSKCKKLKINERMDFGKDKAVFGSSENSSSDYESTKLSSYDLNNKFECNTCNKCFSSYQALGGHKSSHYKAKNTNQALLNDFSPLIIQGDNTKESHNLHRCKTCNRTFATGQALGGHQRCHWAGQTEDLVSSHGTGPTEGPPNLAMSSTGVRGFDLNEMPLMEEDGGDESCNDEEQRLMGWCHTTAAAASTIKIAKSFSPSQ